MRDAVRHRGPDDVGIWLSQDRLVGLAQQRLAIIDLSPAGHQPMSDATGNIWITFNGEIYNFQELRRNLEGYGWQFQTNTDTEVMLYAYHQWGDACVQHFNGMFAFGIYDANRRRLFLARDRMGKKPLYYFDDGQQFAFASECKALLPLRDQQWPLDLQALNFYFAFGYIPGSLSIFKGIRKLLPGHCLTYDLETGAYQSYPYWVLPSRTSVDQDAEDPEALLNELDALLEDSVGLRLISDVPLGILLSGGVDSSLVTAMAARVSHRPVKTFTITFPGSGYYNEAPYARLVANYFGTEHHELPVTTGNLDTLRAVAAHLDEPLADPSILPTYLVSQLTRQHVTVALGGDGGDELFGGYVWYRVGLQAQEILTHVPKFVRQAAAIAVSGLPIGLRGRNYIRSLADDLCYHRVASSSIFDSHARRRLFSPGILEAVGHHLDDPDHYFRSLWLSEADHVLQMSALDLCSFLPDDILFKVDRASMAFALEVRAPWLDYRIVEFVLTRVPSTLKVTRADNRILQRRLAERLLPSSLDLKRKQGFMIPLHQWMAGLWGDQALLTLGNTDARHWLNLDFIQKLLRGQRRGYSNGLRLFACLMLGLWLDGLRYSAPQCVTISG